MDKADQEINLGEFHWMMEMLQNIDVGLVVLDREYRIKVWNSFMANHSGLRPHFAVEKNLFDLFPEIPEEWLRHKGESVFLLKNRAFTIWEQRPFVFKFKNYQPITGTAEFMYQNMTIIPLASVTGEVNHICLIIYDVTDTAVNKQGMAVANSQLEQLSRTDRLTQLNNRGFWEECLVNEFKRFKRTGQNVSLVMFDIDHFKKVNDTYGHQAGDEVIRKVSDILRKNMRETDIAGRYGGEEFAAILVNTDASSAAFFAERLRRGAAKCIVSHDGRDINFTISLGIADLTEDVADHQAWIERADQALYHSKEGGRNQLTVFDASVVS